VVDAAPLCDILDQREVNISMADCGGVTFWGSSRSADSPAIPPSRNLLLNQSLEARALRFAVAARDDIIFPNDGAAGPCVRPCEEWSG
jgi:hypothetical protein